MMTNNLGNSEQAAQLTYNPREEIEEIAEIATSLDRQGLDDIIYRIENARLIEYIAIQDIRENAETKQYCMKTGQYIGQISDDEIARLIKSCGRDRAIEIVKIRTRNCVASHWLFTDGKALDLLMENDPKGYFVYAAGNILQIFQPSLQGLNEENKEELLQRFYKLKQILWHDLEYGQIQLEDIIATNEMMRRYLSITRSVAAFNIVKFTETRLDKIAKSEESITRFHNEIKQSIKALIKHAQRVGKITGALTYGDIVNLTMFKQAHSNFRQQKRLKGMTDIEHVLFELQEFMPKSEYEAQKLFGNKKPQIGVKPETHKGMFKLNIGEKKQQPLKLSFAEILGQRRK